MTDVPSNLSAQEPASPEATAERPSIEPEVLRFDASDSASLHYRHWVPERGKPRGYIVALHGVQSHSGWYAYSSRKLCEAGYEVFYFDRRGSGLNMETRGDAQHCDRLINDVVQFLQFVRHRRNQSAPTRPVVLQAVSWSGKLAAVIAARRPELVDALALLSPGIHAKTRPSLWQRCQLELANRCGIRERRVPIPLNDPTLFTDSVASQQFIREDPLALHEVTVSFLLADRELSRLSRNAPARLRVPLLLMLADQDEIIDNPATAAWFERCKSTRKQVNEYADARHTLEFAADKDEHVDDLIDWLGSIEGMV